MKHEINAVAQEKRDAIRKAQEKAKAKEGAE
jgi:hypothetical protein